MMVRALVVVSILSLGAVGCSGNASCDDALTHFYGQKCTITVSGSAVSLTSAISGCKDTVTTAKAKNCEGNYHTVLNCMNSATSCSGCNVELASFNACMAK